MYLYVKANSSNKKKKKSLLLYFVANICSTFGNPMLYLMHQLMLL